MKFDVNILRYLDKDTWRVLVATEMGMKNHEIVPVELINAIAGLKRGGGFKHIKELLKAQVGAPRNREYDGYRLTPLGYDFLALKAFVNRGSVTGVGRKIGVGKESDVCEVIDGEGRQISSSSCIDSDARRSETSEAEITSVSARSTIGYICLDSRP